MTEPIRPPHGSAHRVHHHHRHIKAAMDKLANGADDAVQRHRESGTDPRPEQRPRGQ